MKKAGGTRKPRFEESDFDDAGYAPRFSHITGGPNLPPVEFKVEDIADSATPEEMIRAAMDDRAVETVLADDMSFGPVVVPSEHSLYGYKYALGKGGHDIRFSHEKYALFDRVIVTECGVDSGGNPTFPAFNPRLEYYSPYSPLRRNLAILRNYLMVTTPPAGDKVKQALLRAMASLLGRALSGAPQKPTLWQRILQALRRMMGKSTGMPDEHRFLSLANTPDRGIAFMYDYLCRKQASPEFMGAMPAGTQPPKGWKLLPLEETPFSGPNMARHSDASRMGLIAAALDLVTRNLNSVDDMTPKDKEISVDHARDILKNLRIIMTGQQEEKQYDEMDPRCREAQSILSSALCFQGALAELARGDPDLLNDPLILEASKSIVKIGSRVKQEETTMQKEEKRAEQSTTTPSQQQPQQGRSKSRPEKQKQKGESINKLMFKFEEGINRAGEIRRSGQARTKQRSLQQAMEKQVSLPKALKEGKNIMSSPKIHQISISDPDLMESVKKVNEEKAVEQKKGGPGGQTLGGGGTSK